MQYFVNPVVTDWDVAYDFFVLVVNLAPVVFEKYRVSCLCNTTDGDDGDANVGSVQSIPQDYRSRRRSVGHLNLKVATSDGIEYPLVSSGNRARVDGVIGQESVSEWGDMPRGTLVVQLSLGIT